MNHNFLREALQQKVLPAVTFSSVNEALPVAEAILKGGLSVMEVPFRTDVAADVIAIIRKTFPEICIGAGTLLTAAQIVKAIDAGAQFGLAPGFNPTICRKAQQHHFPFIPGVMTPSEIELSAEMGFSILKLFPAAQVGGIAFLKAIQAPYAQLNLQFIPMGGVTIDNMSAYLQLKNVTAVGGSWLASRELIAAKAFVQITENVKEALLKTK